MSTTNFISMNMVRAMRKIGAHHTLGYEHELHRMKILTSVEQLREADRIKLRRLYGAHNPDEMPAGGGGGGGASSSIGSPVSTSRLVATSSMPLASSAVPSPARPTAPGDEATGSSALVATAAGTKMLVSFPDLCTLVRHGKLKQSKDITAHDRSK